MEKNVNSAAQAYTVLKDFLLGSSVYVGQKISPLELGSKLGISQTPLREAFLRLAAEGMLAHQNHRGFWVQEITFRQASEIYETRMVMEPAMLDKAVERITDEDIRLFQGILEEYKELVIRPYSRRRLWVDREFHVLLARRSGNETMADILCRLFDHLLMKRRLQHLPLQRGREAYKEHSRLLEAVEARDIKEAQRRLCQHLVNGRDFVLGDLRSREDQEETFDLRSIGERSTAEEASGDREWK